MNASNELPDELRCSTEDRLDSNNNEDWLQSAQEQLAELSLFARSDLHRPASSFPVLSNEVAETLVAANDEGEVEQGEKPHVVAEGKLSSSTVIQAAEKAVMPLAAHSNAAPFNQLVEDPPLCSRKAAKRFMTLAIGVEGEGDYETEESSHVISTLLGNELSRSSEGMVSIPHEQISEERESDENEFAEMLKHLSRGKLDHLALRVEDLTSTKLNRVHTALSKAQESTSTMPFVRTLVSIDMLQLLLRRLGARALHDGVSQALQRFNDGAESDFQLNSTALVTSSNIAAVVLKVRQELTIKINVASSPSSQLRLNSPMTSRSRRTSTFSSSSGASSPRRSTLQSIATDRRSILAKDGAHVLIHEKIMAFDYRGQTSMLSAFRVRGASPTLTDAAARRRQRGLQYANEHVSQRTMHM